MSEPIIRVENLGKKYLIRHQQQEPYTALRDVITNGVKSLGCTLVKGGRKKLESPSREEFWALKDVSFEINRGDRVGIIGRNGAGKSTLLKILSRITEPTTGRINIKGRVASLLEVGTGFHPELTGRENIYLNGAILGMSKVEIKKKFDEIVAFAEVEKFLDTPVKRYSSGMYVRLAFSVAAHLEPEILIVDEVLAVGDLQFQEKCLGKMEDVGKDGRTVLFVSHQMGMISQLCSKALILEKGKISKEGSVEKIISSYINSLTDKKSNTYKGIELNSNRTKSMWISEIGIYNTSGQPISEIMHTESITVKVECKIQEFIKGVMIGITTKDVRGRKIFTTQKLLDDIFKNNDPTHLITSFIKLPGNLLAPGIYCFTIALHIPNVQFIDKVDDVCLFKINDCGNELSMYGDVDYGCVLVNCQWEFQ
ncbi:ABC transporter ATP-binding protein [Roseofilum capinflatum]|uniref:ABC transporter ATP-binding protein n=1 Tax=Roseofilum capinflatum BLCC-M114 TaxID=3022440 RepID=A0ABT7B8A9_9CYAN|nr:ABC transporter ATP-binding protein [Roseofilum capinflatum]MDJ1175411.1 ABC transporter ATP-binding protein [Roseofilum capinflatum BLCC-M114]